MTTEELTTCDECETEMSLVTFDRNDGLCGECLAKTFVCEACGERTPKSDAHPDILTHCESCGDSAIEAQHEERLDAASDQLRELVESIIDGADLDVIAKALKSLKRLSK